MGTCRRGIFAFVATGSQAHAHGENQGQQAEQGRARGHGRSMGSCHLFPLMQIDVASATLLMSGHDDRRAALHAESRRPEQHQQLMWEDYTYILECMCVKIPRRGRILSGRGAGQYTCDIWH